MLQSGKLQVGEKIRKSVVHSFLKIYSVLYLTSGDFCSLLNTFANSLNPDEARPDLDLNRLTLMVFLKELLEKNDFEKN